MNMREFLDKMVMFIVATDLVDRISDLNVFINHSQFPVTGVDELPGGYIGLIHKEDGKPLTYKEVANVIDGYTRTLLWDELNEIELFANEQSVRDVTIIKDDDNRISGIIVHTV